MSAERKFDGTPEERIAFFAHLSDAEIARQIRRFRAIGPDGKPFMARPESYPSLEEEAVRRGLSL